jgi:hypothetical protein
MSGMNNPLSTVSETDRGPAGRFNGTPGPGRPKGSIGGRAAALATLDKILGEEQVQAQIGDAMRQAVMDDPLKFFRQIVMPLLPAESKHEITGSGAPWGSLVDMIQQRRALEAKAKEAKQ